MKVHFTADECVMGATAGIFRQMWALSHGCRDYHGADSRVNGWQVAIEGCLGEHAVAKAANIWHCGRGVFRGPDVGEDWEVRTSGHRNGRLIIREKDHDEAPYILVIGFCRDYELKGWMLGRDAKKECYLTAPDKTRQSCYCVPAADLKPMEELFNESNYKEAR